MRQIYSWNSVGLTILYNYVNEEPGLYGQANKIIDIFRYTIERGFGPSIAQLFTPSGCLVITYLVCGDFQLSNPKGYCYMVICALVLTDGTVSYPPLILASRVMLLYKL